MANIQPPSFSVEFQKEVDDFFKNLKKLIKNCPLPKNGMISFTQMHRRKTNKWIADQLLISPAAFSIMTKNEKNKKSNIKTLEKAAFALNCDLFYCLIPKE